MKRHMQALAIVFLISSGLYSEIIFGAQAPALPKYTGTPIKVAPSTVGDDSIVDAIKYYSDLTDADVNQYKLLIFGRLGNVGAFALGAYSSFIAGKKAYESAPKDSTGLAAFFTGETMSNYLPPQNIQNLLTSPYVWSGVGSIGAALVSYKILYPRIRAGVLNKIQKYIDVCEGLRPDGGQYSIAYHWWNTVGDIKQSLPAGWRVASDFAVYNALDNLVVQGQRANALLTRIGLDDQESKDKRKLIDVYVGNLDINKSVYAHALAPEIAQKKAEEERIAQLNNLNAQTNLASAGKYALYGSLVKGTVSSVWNGIKELYAHPEILALFSLAWITKDYIKPSLLSK